MSTPLAPAGTGEPAAPPATPGGRALVGGVAWIATFRWASQVLSWAATLLVVRLLAPSDYGIATLALAVVSVAAVLSEFGLGTAVVAVRDLSRSGVAEAHGAALGLGLAVGGLLALGSPLLAWFYREPALRAVLPALSLVFVAEGARVVPVSMLARALRYRETALLDFFKAASSAILVLALAVRGAGYWALVLGHLGGSVVTTLWVLARHGQPLARPTRSGLAPTVHLARNVVVARAAWILYRTSDIFVAGRLFGTSLLGYYTMAWNFASLPGEKLGNVLTGATAPFFAAIQEDRAALRHYFLRVTEALALVLYPALFGFLLVADLVVPLVLGAQWLPSVPILRVLVFYAAVQGVQTPISQVLNVTGHSRTAMRGGLLALAVLPPAFFLGGKLGGLMGVAVAWLVAYPVVMSIPLPAVLRVLSLSPREYLSATRVAVEGVIVMAVAVVALRALPWGPSSAWPELGAAVATGATAYLGTLWVRHRRILVELHAMVRSRRGGASSPVPGPG